MLKSIASIILLGLMLVSCNSGTSEGIATSLDQKDTMSNEVAVESGVEAPLEQAVPLKGEQYEIIVLNDTIKSPRKELRGTIGSTNITVNYGSPAVNGRELWGGLVPFGKVSRTGANEAVKISLSAPLKLGGTTIPEGAYSLFTLPENQEDWSYIINKVADQWGAYEYDQGQDVARVKTSSTTSETFSERMDFSIVDNKLQLHWGNLIIPVALAEVGK